MKTADIRAKAKDVGAHLTKGMKKDALIRAIQQAEGFATCYATSPATCGQEACLWREDCLKAVS